MMTSNPELKASRITVGVHTLVAVAIGWLSPQINAWLAGLIGIVILFMIGHLSERIVGEKKGAAWWIGNGAFIYLLVWLITWTYFFNVLA